MCSIKSKWLDQRDIPDGKWGKNKIPGCVCNNMFTCGACLQRAVDRNKADSTPRKETTTKEEQTWNCYK